jgi:hypothetical protein
VERRKREKRIQQRLPLRLGGSRTEPGTVGYTRDLSEHGLCISAPASLPAGSRLRIKLRLPDERICRVEGVVVWRAGTSMQADVPALMGVRIDSAPAPYAELVAAQTRPVDLLISEAIDEELIDPLRGAVTTQKVRGGQDPGPKSSRPRSVGATKRPAGPACRLIAVTGNASSRKPELMEAIRKQFRQQVILLPDLTFVAESAITASAPSREARKTHQRAVLERVMEMEQAVADPPQYPVALCQFTTLDCLRSWIGDEASFWAEIRTTRDQQIRRYDMVIHLRPPLVREGGTPAAVKAHRTLEAPWAGHPRREIVEWTPDPERQLAQVATLVKARFPNGA